MSTLQAEVDEILQGRAGQTKVQIPPRRLEEVWGDVLAPGPPAAAEGSTRPWACRGGFSGITAPSLRTRRLSPWPWRLRAGVELAGWLTVAGTLVLMARLCAWAWWGV